MTTPRERPILFSSPMVRALLAGTKTQTRRLVKPGVLDEGWPAVAPLAIASAADRCPYGAHGDRLWVRETFNTIGGRHFYRAAAAKCNRWKPAIHMPRAASRLDLDVTGVRVERLQDITEEDVIAEGVQLAVTEEGRPLIAALTPYQPGKPIRDWTIADYWRSEYACLWDAINGKRAGADWASNPWVWVVSFKRFEAAS